MPRGALDRLGWTLDSAEPSRTKVSKGAAYLWQMQVRQGWTGVDRGQGAGAGEGGPGGPGMGLPVSSCPPQTEANTGGTWVGHGSAVETVASHQQWW